MRPAKKWHDIGLNHAINGLWHAIKSEKNLKIELLATCIVILSARLLGTSRTENAVLALTVGHVFVAELLNTALEYAVDFTGEDFSEKAKMAKDIAAGAVLVIALAAIIVALFIFVPKIQAIHY